MKSAIIPENEVNRQASLDLYDILDTLPEKDFDSITSLAAFICQTPIALISLIDRDRQWFKSHHGLDATETPRDYDFCTHAILKPDELFIVEDASHDERFHDNPLSTDNPHVIFYAGVPLVNDDGMALGTLCVIDHTPHQLNEDQKMALSNLSTQVIAQMELRKKLRELEAVRDDLERKNQDVSRFAHLISHDLRSPMRSMVMLTEIIQEESEGKLNESAEKALIQLQSKAIHSNKLVEGILAHSLAGEKIITLEHIQADDFIQGLIDFCSPPSDILVLSDIHIQEFVSDPTYLHQILQNLIANAIKYNDKAEGVIHIRVDSTFNELQFEVSDNGPGIPAAFQERIFGMFQTLSSTDRFGKKGTGIGLNTVKRLVELLQGRIELESAEGEGTTFRVTLPKSNR